MYTKNTIGRRRPSGWVERRRYLQRLFVRPRVELLKGEENQTLVPAGVKD